MAAAFGRPVVAFLAIVRCTTSLVVTGAAPGLACVRGVRGSPRLGKPALLASAGSEGAPGSAGGPTVYFVMGGPGSGKGTQCEKLVAEYGFTHLSAGDLLRQEVQSGSDQGVAIKKIIDEGKIVTSEITVGLLRKAMEHGHGPFLIDGFPRSLSNMHAYEAAFPPCKLMLLLELSEEEMESRLLKRGESSGRSDDNAATIRKRFHTYLHDSMPVVEDMERRGLVRRVDASATVEAVFARVCESLADQGLRPLASC